MDQTTIPAVITAVRRALFGNPALLSPSSVAVPEVAPALRGALPTNRNAYEISAELGSLLASFVVREGCRRILEFGAGASSRVHAAALALVGGGQVTAIERDPSWCAKVWTEVERYAAWRVDARMVAAPVRWMVGAWGMGFAQPDAVGEVSERAPYDLVLIDAPGGQFGRLGTLPLVADFLTPGARIVVDDAGGASTRQILTCWLERYAGLQLEALDPVFGKRGVAILRWSGGETRWSTRAWLGGAYHALSRWRRRRELARRRTRAG